ncbi:MAG: exonuclease SbcCD subunit D [Lactobacillaceae bacterium]|jgi:exonuclease SbcD|nr:exonuclease SbcCD subunit D [Lactobacillaceae bacterium]
MKLLHTADWHIGKELGAFSLLAEQKYAYEQILNIAIAEQVDGIIIAGDLYDRAIAPLEAVEALEGMLRDLNLTHGLPIYAVSGNHDGATRLGAGHEWREQTGLHLNTTLANAFEPIETSDAQIFLLPFIDPIDARAYYQMEPEEALDYQTIEAVMAKIVPELEAKFAQNKAHILVTHFNVTGTGNEDYEFTSETNSRVGGLKGVPAGVFNGFDYVALGHIHLRQASPNDTMQYAGSPVKFNTKEAQSEKGVYILDITANELQTTWHPLKINKDLIVVKGTYAELIDPDFYQQYARGGANWFSIAVQDVPSSRNARGELNAIYGDVIEVNYTLQSTSVQSETEQKIIADEISPEEIVASFYHDVTQQAFNAEQQGIVVDIFTAINKAKEN